ncbi:unnamed protein product [Adineta steineri]|uniref:Uncharacterized protein n=1 Tax=Adineta steineri TaxID=433720 RepID=A0A815VEN0_9BILA|nr:unnamed protein product [Adineta steineri]CAF1653093.1 unnamed protein product [Adineta steineri]
MNNNVTLMPHICFIVCDSGPAAHFAVFANQLSSKNEIQVSIYASGPALTKLKDSHLSNDIQLLPFTFDDSDRNQQDIVAIQLIDNCVKQNVRTIIVDIGNKFDAVFQTVLSKYNLSSNTIHSWCYYDNTEPYVPGGYSIKTEGTIKISPFILFANMNLASIDSNIYSLPEKKIDLTNKTKQSIGYYPVIEIEKLFQQRQIERDILRTQNNWNKFKYLFVYFGGNNDTYFDQAFPAFLSNLSQIENYFIQDILFLVHQHPAAKKQNRDALLLQD